LIRSLIAAPLFIVFTLVGIAAALTSRLFDRSGDTVLYLARIWSRLILWIAGIKVRVHLDAPLDPRRPYVFMANHASALDIWALYVAVPVPVRMIAKKQLGEIPVFGWAMHAGRFIFIDRQNPVAARRSIDEATQRIHDGTSVLIFPEGTRSLDGRLAPFKKGGFFMAINSGAEIVPVGIRGAHELMPPGTVRFRRGEIWVNIGAPVSTAGLTERDREGFLERVRDIVLHKAGQAAETHDAANHQP
jgi:1-acyl-sn-glycerol-3-phosphate acyltransferase